MPLESTPHAGLARLDLQSSYSSGGLCVHVQVSMSSTSIVVKCLTDANATNSPHGQITIGTLILQDCMVGLLFAFMPVLASNRSEEGGDALEAFRLLARSALALHHSMLMLTCFPDQRTVHTELSFPSKATWQALGAWSCFGLSPTASQSCEEALFWP